MSKVLVIEDNRMVLGMLKEWLTRRDFEAVTASNGSEGIEMARRESPALILLDMSLPLKDGWTVARELKAMPEFARVPIIALTAHAIQGDRQIALSAGCDDYMSKPIDFSELLKKMRVHLAAASSPDN